MDLTPLISETNDSGSVRVNNIKKLIQKCKYSIHDISRCEALKKNKLPRFNMPFELGIDIGCQTFSLKTKRNLILEKEPYRYQKVLSDISGQDIKNHNNDPEELVLNLRNWFSLVLKKNLIAGSKIWTAYNEFIFDFTNQMKKEGFKKKDIESLPKSNLIRYMKAWLSGRPII